MMAAKDRVRDKVLNMLMRLYGSVGQGWYVSSPEFSTVRPEPAGVGGRDDLIQDDW